MFMIKSPDRSFYLQAENDTDLLDWMTALKKILEQIDTRINREHSSGFRGTIDMFKKDVVCFIFNFIFRFYHFFWY